MKYLSFKSLLAIIILPSFLYIFTIQGLEKILSDRFTKELNETYIGDTNILFEGTEHIESVIEKNINKFLKSKKLFLWSGGEIDILVTTQNNQILYPPTYFPNKTTYQKASDMLKTARDNFRMLNDGLNMKMILEIDHNTKLSNFILLIYITIAANLLFFYIRSVGKKIKEETNEFEKELDKLRFQENEYKKRLKKTEIDRNDLTNRIKEIKTEIENEKNKANTNEEEMINEIILLEEKLEENIKFCNTQNEEIEALQRKLIQYESSKADKKEKNISVTEKRFKTLYKNTEIMKKALTGFEALTDEMKIKCEELIHQLNENPDQIKIKRKVFNKKSKSAFYEIIFSYKGRLYFGKEDSGKVKIYVIGTKNTQTKDLEFLDNI